MIRVCIIGLGKTGKEIARVLLEEKNIKLVSAVCSEKSEKKGKDLGEIIGYLKTGIIVDSCDKLEEIIFKSKPEVVIDFTNPESSLNNAKIFSKMKVNMIIGTTGFSKISLKKLFLLTRRHHNAIVYAPNITLGVNVLMFLTNIASSILNNYDFNITEVHHKKKKDSPSGTALKIAAEIGKGLAASGIFISDDSIPINAIRAGGVVGRHEVMITGENDKIEISHESFSRKAFALGALHAVSFIHGKTGYFEMSDVLKFEKVLYDYLEKANTSFKKRYISYRNNTTNPINFKDNA